MDLQYKVKEKNRVFILEVLSNFGLLTLMPLITIVAQTHNWGNSSEDFIVFAKV